MSQLSKKQIKEIEELWESNTPISVQLFDQIADNDLRSKVEKLSRNYIAEEFPSWNPDPRSKPQLLGGNWVKFLNELKKDKVKNLIKNNKNEIKKAICEDFEYCNKRKLKGFQSESISLAIAIADGLIASASSLPIPITTLSVYLVKHKILDNYCECDD